MTEFTGRDRQVEQAEMIASGSMTAEAGRLFRHFDDVHPSLHPDKWHQLWEESFIPWDRGCPSPALIDLLEENMESLGKPLRTDGSGKRKTALVPGCGRGYDVLLLSAFGYDTYGLDFSATAIASAEAAAPELENEYIYRVRNKTIGRGAVNWINGDFFAVFSDSSLRFDLIYDYTFLCALPPELRPSWSRRITQLLSPTGKVVCLEYPTYKPPSAGGPPWACPSKVHLAHLQHPGEELPYENGDLAEDKVGPAAPEGLQRIAHFQPRRTHRVGYDADGNVVDTVSIWAH